MPKLSVQSREMNGRHDLRPLATATTQPSKIRRYGHVMAADYEEVSDPIELEDDVADYDLVEDDELTLESLSDLVLYTLDWSVSSLLERIGTNFDINPTFQRRDAWTVERKSLYVESLIVGLPVPQIVLAEDKDHKGRFIVLDGKQRLISIKQFAAPDETFPGFKLKKLEFAKDVEGMTFADMSSSLVGMELAEGFLSQPIRTIVVRNWSDPAVLYQVFVRLNQGSVSLSPQELRQALFPSEFTKWIDTRSALSVWIQRARRLKKADFRMRDAEMLLRYVAFAEHFEEYRGVLRQFLDDACRTGSQEWTSKGQQYFENLAESCERAIERTYEVFGENAFQRFENGSYNRRFNIAVFDAMTAVLGDPTFSASDLTSNVVALREIFERMCESNREFADSLQSTTKSIPSTAGRVLLFGREVEALLGHDLEITARAEALLNR
jgi:hypothetical protein